jgi:hypothetical protein
MVFCFSFILCVLALAIPVSSIADTLYKCEENGVMVFSDTPCRGKQIGSEFMESGESRKARRNVTSDQRKRRIEPLGSETEKLFNLCNSGDTSACASLNIAGPGVIWREQYRTQHTITNGQQLSGKYARYPTETEVIIECLPSRLLRSVHIRKDIDAIFLRDGDMVLRPENNYRRVREYGSRFSTIDEAAKAACSGPPPK